MPMKGERQVRWRPRGVSDTIDGDNSPPGAMTALTNLIQSPDTPNTFICRPANIVLVNFSNWKTAAGSNLAPGNVGVITAEYSVGDIIYGLVGITSGTYAGLDYPFAYDALTGAFLAVSGITLASCPVSQATSGQWVPPQMALMGTLLGVTHVGFPGAAGAFFGWFNILNPILPSWNSGNTTGNPLPTVPVALGIFNSRTYFACANSAYYTDTLAYNMTASNQSLNIGDYTNIQTFAPLAIDAVSEGILQGLLAFKLNTIYLITGDEVLMNLGEQLLSTSVGTAAPRSVVPTPDGIRFMANDGIRHINYLGLVGEPDEDLAVPFINAVVPSRVCAAYNADTYRICVENGAAVSSPYQDYWYNLRRKSWTGPHSFQYDIAIAVGKSTADTNDFALASNALPGEIWDSYVVQNQGGLGNTFIENGVPLTFSWETPPMTDLDNLYANKAAVSTIEISAPAEGQTYNFTAQDQNGSVLSTAAIMESSGAAIWGSFLWGAADWGGSVSGLTNTTIPWNSTVVFNRLSVLFTGNSSLGLEIGSLHLGYKQLKYLLH